MDNRSNIKKHCHIPAVYFYVPGHSWPEDLSPGVEYFWSSNRGGKWNWTFQTFEYLKKAGVACSLVTELPEEGIVIAHRKLYPLELKPTSRQLIVCIEADRGRMPFAQLHVQQNPVGTALANSSWLGRLERKLFRQNTNHFIYYWPQPGLIPRDRSRGARFQNIVFQGRERHLIKELRADAFKKEVEGLGLNYIPHFSKEQWNDYSDVDCVIAIRDARGLRHTNKPATKLYNAWHAGVPAILNPESAYLAESELDANGVPTDFIPAKSKQDVIDALRRLSADGDLRKSLVAKGHRNSSRTSPERIVRYWIDFLNGYAIPAYEDWMQMSEHNRRLFFLLRDLHFGQYKSGKRLFQFSRRRVGVEVPESHWVFELENEI
jgi:hypothetical protein